MDRAVLPDLELGQMETECFRLPDQVLQLAVGLSRRASAGQRVLRAPKVRYELVSTSVCLVASNASRVNALGDMEKELAMGLGWRALLDLRPPIGRCGAQRGQPAPMIRARS